MKPLNVILVAAAAALLALVPVTSADARWNAITCKRPGKAARMTGGRCCHDEHCYDLKTREECEAVETCAWGGKRKGSCKPNRDDGGKVCCLSGGNKDCEDIVNGICPEMYQVTSLLSV